MTNRGQDQEQGRARRAEPERAVARATTAFGWLGGGSLGLLANYGLFLLFAPAYPTVPTTFVAFVLGAFGGMTLADRLGPRRGFRVLGPSAGVLMVLAIALAVVAWLLGGCAHGAPAVPREPRAVPDDDAARHRALAEGGLRFYRALAAGHPRELLFGDLALRRLLEPQMATRMAARRLGLEQRLAVEPGEFARFREARYGGICVQGARVAEAGGTLGLREPGWVFDRALLMGERPGGERVASWVEGIFVYTNAGFGAIVLTRVETPRWKHTDLRLAPCDMEVGIHGPLPVVDAAS